MRRELAANALFDALVRPGNDIVTLSEVFDGLGLTPPWPRMYRMIARMDPDNDGEISRTEMIDGMHLIVGYQLDRNMGLDGDLDEKLSLREFALGYTENATPRDDAEYTAAQIESFKQNDLNQDGLVSRDELDVEVTRYYLRLFRAWRLSGVLAEQGIATEGYVSEAVFALLWGTDLGAKVPEEIAERYKQWAGDDPEPPLRYLGGYLSQLPLEEFETIERTLDTVIQKRNKGS